MLEEPFFFFLFTLPKQNLIIFKSRRLPKPAVTSFFSDEESEPATVQMKTQKKVYVVT